MLSLRAVQPDWLGIVDRNRKCTISLAFLTRYEVAPDSVLSSDARFVESALGDAVGHRVIMKFELIAFGCGYGVRREFEAIFADVDTLHLGESEGEEREEGGEGGEGGELHCEGGEEIALGADACMVA